MSLLTLISLMALTGHAYMAAVPTNQIEVMFFVDQAVVQEYITAEGLSKEAAYSQIKTDGDFYISEINKIFEKVGYGLAVVKRGLVIMEKDLWNVDNVERDQGLKDFDAWRKEQDTYVTYKQDVAVLWTGKELVRDDGNRATAGYANVGMVCDPDKSSLLAEFDGTYKAVVVTAHEIGHVCGSGHDSDTLRRVMGSEAAASSENRWQFSEESATKMQAKISGVSCLTETSPESEYLAIEAPPADVVDPDIVCKRTEKNADSYMVRSKFYYEMIPPHGDLICKAIYCFNGEVDSADAAYASDGMLCGKNKRCSQGKCVDSPDEISGAASDDCPNKEQPVLHLSGFTGSCSDLVAKFSKGICYHYDSMCCVTCGQHKTGDTSCAYGDKSPKCAGISQESVCGGSSASTCCGLCQGYVGKRSADVTATAIVPEEDGLEPQVVRKNGENGELAD